MEIRLSTSDGVPVYRQIVNQVKHLVTVGRLRPGEELPPIRALAEQLVINPNTVVHAYAELEKEGVVTGRHGSGTYVAETVGRKPSPDAIYELETRIDVVLEDAIHLNMEIDEVLQLVLERYRRLKKSRKL